MLKTRILSALVLAPLVLAEIYLGGYWLDGLLVVAGGLMGWEWARLCGGGKLGAGAYVVILALATIPFWFELSASWPLVLAVLGGTVLVLLANLARGWANAFWLAGGTLYIGLGVAAFLWLRARPEDGLALVLWILAVVWSVDIGAYFAGRGFGGPKLAPAISPNKTWAGLFGGAAAAAAVSAAAVPWLGKPLIMMILFGIALAVISQAGDLLESWCKRRFGVKDSSHIIPGHGGILDRVDGLLAVLPFAFVYFWALEARL